MIGDIHCATLYRQFLLATPSVMPPPSSLIIDRPGKTGLKREFLRTAPYQVGLYDAAVHYPTLAIWRGLL